MVVVGMKSWKRQRQGKRIASISFNMWQVKDRTCVNVTESRNCVYVGSVIAKGKKNKKSWLIDDSPTSTKLTCKAFALLSKSPVIWPRIHLYCDSLRQQNVVVSTLPLSTVRCCRPASSSSSLEVASAHLLRKLVESLVRRLWWCRAYWLFQFSLEQTRWTQFDEFSWRWSWYDGKKDSLNSG